MRPTRRGTLQTRRPLYAAIGVGGPMSFTGSTASACAPASPITTIEHATAIAIAADDERGNGVAPLLPGLVDGDVDAGALARVGGVAVRAVEGFAGNSATYDRPW